MEEKTSVIPPASMNSETSAQQEKPSDTKAAANLPSNNGRQKHTQGNKPWKQIITAIIAFIIGAAITSCGSTKPQDTQEYKDLDAKYSKVNDDLRSTKSELSDTKKELKAAKEKADKWDKEQADKKAAEKKADDEKKAQEQAAQEAAQQQAAQAQAQQQAAQAQAQQQVQTPPQPVQAQTLSQGGPTVHRGAFCSGQGATGTSDQNGATLTCRTARDGRLRWMN